MRIWGRVALVLLLVSCSKPSMKNQICKLNTGKIKCPNGFWSFNESNQKCFNVKRASRKYCGMFFNKKGCVDFCIRSAYGGRKIIK
ncbi:uncharacterized protein Dvir_GJ26281 [Drosophila virilis]|uniref:BPTI/Kunitz inhibitor domain-containing protein n=1 Tax=Drosophila virilis TaxID=7244 RepID=A0A0Q9WJA6_DROVI|nr:uncharacterized protein Dvir_GJ26281 [Drosophila virilis]